MNRQLLQNPRYQDPKRLNRYEYQVYSQNGEDGILAEILRRIGSTNKFFVEFGAGEETENNTTYLLLRGFSGFWMDSDGVKVRAIEKDFGFLIAAGRLRIRQAFVAAENVTDLFQEARVPAEFDVLCIDIDGNDYWVWKALKGYSPRVVIIEYNSMFRPDMEWIAKYDSNFRWRGKSYFGASLASMVKLGTEKGYRLVGCDFRGVNAFFIRGDLVGDKFLEPFTAENHYEPPRYNLSTKIGYPRQFGDYEQP